MEVGGQVHTPAALPREKEPLVNRAAETVRALAGIKPWYFGRQSRVVIVSLLMSVKLTFENERNRTRKFPPDKSREIAFN